jgi:hypothetical protein
MCSTRLPGKILEDLAGQPMLKRVVCWASRAKTLTDSVVATKKRSEDDVLVHLCETHRWPCLEVCYNYLHLRLSILVIIPLEISSDPIPWESRLSS